MLAKHRKLDKSIISDLKEAKKALGIIEGKVFDRIDYILHFVFETFDNTLHNWYFEDANEGGMGNLYMDKDWIYDIFTDATCQNNMVMFLKDGKQYEYDGIFPSRWLFEDFEEEVLQGKQAWIDEQEAKKKKSKKAKETRNAKREEVLNKLSKEERKLLGV